MLCCLLLQRSPARHGVELDGEERVGEHDVRTRGVHEDVEAARKPQHLSRLASNKDTGEQGSRRVGER